MPPTASLQLHPPAPPPPLPAPRHVPTTLLRSRPIRFGIPGSLPDRRSAPETQCFHPATSAPDRPSSTSALHPPSQTGPPQNAPPSAPPASYTRAPLLLPRCTAPLPLPQAPALRSHPICIFACSRSDGQSGQISYSMY